MSTQAPRQATQRLWAGIQEADPAVVRAAIADGADIEARDDAGTPPVVAATKSGDVALVRILVDAGASPNAKDAIQDSAFLYAGAEGLDDILTLTLAHGADVTSTNRYGGTALIPASEHGHVRTARILIDAGVPVNHVNNLNWTALHEAIVLGTGSADQVEVVRMLLTAGADPSIPDGDGVLPRDLAARRGLSAIVALLDDAA